MFSGSLYFFLFLFFRSFIINTYKGDLRIKILLFQELKRVIIRELFLQSNEKFLRVATDLRTRSRSNMLLYLLPAFAKQS